MFDDKKKVFFLLLLFELMILLLHEMTRESQQSFNTKDLSQLKYLLGVNTTKSRKGILLSESKNVIDLLKETKKLGVNLSSIPMTPNTHLIKDDGDLFDNLEGIEGSWKN